MPVFCSGIFCRVIRFEIPSSKLEQLDSCSFHKFSNSFNGHFLALTYWQMLLNLRASLQWILPHRCRRHSGMGVDVWWPCSVKPGPRSERSKTKWNHTIMSFEFWRSFYLAVSFQFVAKPFKIAVTSPDTRLFDTEHRKVRLEQKRGSLLPTWLVFESRYQ